VLVPGNSKLGLAIWTFSLPAVTTCPGGGGGRRGPGAVSGARDPGVGAYGFGERVCLYWRAYEQDAAIATPAIFLADFCQQAAALGP